MFRTTLRTLRAVRPAAQLRSLHTARPQTVSRAGLVLGAAGALMVGGVVLNEAKKEPKADAKSDDKTDDKSEDKPEGQEGAYNPETGEINWDCPCLGGMANGPCGEQFKAAFSCFVYSEAEPKGMDCIEKFSAMQDCFREHPEIYAEQLKDDDEEEKVVQEAIAKTNDVVEEVKVEEVLEHKVDKADRVARQSATEIKKAIHETADALHEKAQDISGQVDSVAKKVGLVTNSEDIRKSVTEAIKSAEEAIDTIADTTDSIIDSLGGSVDIVSDKILPVVEKIQPIVEKIEKIIEGDDGKKN